MRRKDIEDILDKVPVPDVSEGMYLIQVLFSIGPTRGEMPLDEGCLEPWERRRGIDLAPWQAELIVQLSQEYMMYQRLAMENSCLCPWPYGRGVWKFVQDEKHKRDQQATLEKKKEQERNGSRKRHRNPP